MPETRTHYRPVGLKEAELILQTGSKAFPPRLPEQPIFYPVVNQEYASHIAREWNSPKESHFAGFVTRFEIDDANFASEMAANAIVVQLNLAWWERAPAESQGLDVGRKNSTLRRISLY